MSQKLQDILISCERPDYRRSLGDLREKIVKAARFEPGDERKKSLDEIIRKVAAKKDKAVAAFTAEFDNVNLLPAEFRVSQEQLQRAHKQTDAALLSSLRGAIANVRKYQSEILLSKDNTHPGVKYTPLKRVGVCVPGASAPLPSTVIMTAVPAQVAGVTEIAVVSPPRYKGGIHPVTLAACFELGITEVYRIGGAQAVAAMAYGTETIPRVDKIVGPGNTWVQMAKKEVFGLVDIDSIAGPSEVLIIADSRANPAWVAADMLSQAEHAPGSAIVFTDSHDIAQAILQELAGQVKLLDRADQTTECLINYSGIVVFANMDEAIDQANDFAPEHLQIQCGDQTGNIAERIENAGAIFIGPYTPVAVGDYWAGPSHTLPTGMSAKFFSALSSNDFVKASSVIEYDKQKLAECEKDITRLAMTEGLDAHAKSVQIRQKK